MTYYIVEPCRGTCDTACVAVCPVECIYPPEGYELDNEEHLEKMRSINEMLYIHPEECIDCGACEPECPVTAIYPEDEVPEDQEAYVQINKGRFGL